MKAKIKWTKKRIWITVGASIAALLLILGSVAGGLFGCYNYLYNKNDPYRDTVSDWAAALPLKSIMTKAEAQSDFEYLKDKISTRHWSARNGLTAKFQAAYDEEDAKLTDSNEVLSVWRACRRILKALDDAHSKMGYNGDNSTDDTAIHTHGQKLRVDNEGKIHITLEETAYPLAKINGVLIEDVIRNARNYLSFENDYWFYEQLETYIKSAEGLAGIGLEYKKDSVTFSYQDKENVENNLTVPYIVIKGSSMGEVPPKFIRYEFDEARSWGKLTLDECRWDDEYRGILKQFFTAVKSKSIKNISVDLSKNYGGNSAVADEFLRYIDVPEYKYFGWYVRWGDYSPEHGPKIARNQLGGAPAIAKNDVYDDLKFGGKIYCITSRKTFSSAMNFTVLLYDNKLATVVGTPLGNAPSSFMDVLAFRLPKSSLGFTTTYKWNDRPDTGNKENTVMPHHKTETPYDKIAELIAKSKG